MKGYEVWGRIEEGYSEFLGLFTEFRKAERKRIASMERHREGRYTPTKEEWAATMREHRAYKHKLHKEGKI